MKYRQTANEAMLSTRRAPQIAASLVGIAAGIVIIVTGKMAQTPALFGAVFIVAGIISGLVPRGQRTTIVKGGEITIMSRALIGGSKMRSFQTNSIVGLLLDAYTSRMVDGQAEASRRSTLYALFADHTVEDIAHEGESKLTVNGINISSIFGRPPLTKEAEQLSQFLGVELIQNDSTSIPNAINSFFRNVQKMSAHTSDEEVKHTLHDPQA